MKKKKMGSHFFQIINDYIVKDRRLGLPKEFVKRFGEQLGKAGLIEDPMGKIWPVELRKAKGEIFFHTGWLEFMEYYSISVGHFLIFRHEGDSHFHVSICDMTACEVDYPCHREDVDESDPEEVSLERTPDETDHSMEDMDVPFQCATRSAHTKANRTRPSCGANPTSHEPKKRSYVKCQEPNPRHCAASKRRFEDDKKARCSVKRNKSDGSGENKSKPVPQDNNFKRHSEVVTISSDDESHDKDNHLQSSSEHNVTDKIAEDKHRMPTPHRSTRHKGKCKIPKKASRAERKVDVSERRLQKEARVIEEARAFKSMFPTCTIIMQPSHLHEHGLVHVPCEFTRDFLTKAGDNSVTLKVSTAKKWCVGYYIRKVGTNSCFQANLYKGWYEFAVDNHLRVGDGCVFELVNVVSLEMKVNIIRIDPDMTFNTMNSDSESDDGRTMPTQPKSASHGGKRKISRTTEVKVHSPGQDASCASPKVDVPELNFQRALGVTKQAKAFKSMFPTCTIIIKPSYLLKGRLVNVPSEFARDFLTKRGDNVLTLKDSTGKQWYVGYKTSSENKASLYRGWYEFAVLENRLKVDDACVFELVDIDNLEMKVNIIRASLDVV